MNIKRIASALLALLLFTSIALAGPFATQILKASSISAETFINVPKGKAMTIVNFIDEQAAAGTSVVSVYVYVDGTNGPEVKILKATRLDDSALGQTNNKDVTIDGPATVRVTAPAGQTTFITYKLFPN
jgi:glyoxylate utilization-related uncharacterized protein